ncbi:MAG: sigma-54-dependent Fis family transcriptional regulator [Treponema sp.]|nr:sigma-54-dependent Fis family transcriptional regulator [Treponema sp.]
MFSKINNASVAVVAYDSDVHLFFECVFEHEFNMEMFYDIQVETVLKKHQSFDLIITDIAAAVKLRDKGLWDTFCETVNKRFFVLAGSKILPEFQKKFGTEVKTISYPFTKKRFYSCIGSDNAAVLRKGRINQSIKIKNFDCNFDNILQFASLLGSSERLNEVRKQILMVADTDLPLIFYGESGTGKTMVAKIAHELSLRKDKPFVIANMANARNELMESSLFGNVRGAFTDARDREGLFKKADGGTLFMDEIADLSLECQAKLLRVIESGVFRPVGSDEECKADVRLIFATNANLESMVRKKLFREDLYWRIVDFPIMVPALRERLEDFPVLIESELKEIQKKMGKVFSITPDAVQKMRGYDWPGNFRQFKACLRRAAVLSRDTGTIDCDAISF